MVAAGKKAGTKFPFLIQSDGDKGDPYTYYPFQTSFGAPGLRAERRRLVPPGARPRRRERRAFATWLGEQGEEGNLSTDISYDIAVEAFAKGQSPFVIGGPWMLEQFKDLDLAVDPPIPAPGGDQPAQPFVGVQAST